MSRKLALAAAIILSLAVIACEAWLAPLMAPTRTRTADEFWETTCGVSPSGRDRGVFHGIAALDDGWYVCRVPAMDAPYYFQVPEADVLAKLPEVERQLESRATTQPADSDNSFIQGYRAWKADPKAHARGVEGLLDEINRALQIRINHEFPNASGLSAVDRFLLEEHIRQARWRWATVVFDGAYLIGLIWYAAWPAIRRFSPWRWALRWGIVPLLFLLPAYLGFVGYTFTGFGPSGGVVYPWLLYATSASDRGCTSWDLTILRHLPQVFEPLAAVEGGWMESFHGYGLWGPTAAVVFGAVIGTVTFVARWLAERRRRLAAKS